MFRQADFIGFSKIKFIKFNFAYIHCNGNRQIFIENLWPNQRFGVEIVRICTISTFDNHYNAIPGNPITKLTVTADEDGEVLCRYFSGNATADEVNTVSAKAEKLLNKYILTK